MVELKAMTEDQLRRYREELAQKKEDLEKRFPAHSLKPAMFAQLEELEEELARVDEELRRRRS